MSRWAHNFNPGPAALPSSALKEAQAELLDFQGTGLSILETSHRSPTYDRVHNDAIDRLRRLLGLDESFTVLFMGGGARTQFALAPMNLLGPDQAAEHIVTGKWSEVALDQARKVGCAREIWSSAATGHDRVPDPSEIKPSSDAAYVHVTSNNTTSGTRFAEAPATNGIPLVADMTSDLLTRPLDLKPYGLIYASAQKNVGPAGVTIVIARTSLVERASSELPDMFSYATMHRKNSMLNTPPVFAIYLVGLVAAHLEADGGLAAQEQRNARKAELVYDAIDASDGFYRGHAQPESRSPINVTFRLPTEELESRFVTESAEAGLVGLKAYKTVGGIRASLYNAVSLEDVQALVEFMDDFQSRHQSEV